MREITNILDIKTGDILLVDSSGFLPEAIHLFQGNDFNHAGIFVWVGTRLYVFEAIKQGQAFTTIGDYLSKQEKGEAALLVLKPSENDFENVDWQEFIDFILPLTHKPYGFVNLSLLIQ